MKRSRTVTLTLFSAVTSAGLAACDQAPPPPKAFETVQECVAAGNEQAGCQTAFDKASETHVATAPRYPSQEACEGAVDVDRCVRTQVRNNDGSFSDVFIPAMAGYMIGRALNNDRGSYGGGGGYASPIYRSRQYPSSFREPGNLTSSGLNRSAPPTISRSPSVPTVSAPARPANLGTTTIARGGFGGSGAHFGGGGS